MKCALLAGALILPGYALAPRASAAVYQVPTSIDRTGTTDASAALDAFIASVPNGATITFPAGSRYRIENIVYVNARQNLTIDGAGAQFFATTTGSAVPPIGPNSVRQHWPRHRDHFLVYEGSNVTLENISLVGPNVNGGTGDAAYVESLEAQAGVEFYGTTNGLLQGCTISMTYGDLVYVGHDANGVRVTGCGLYRSGRMGLTVSDGRDVTFDHNTVSRIRRSAVDLETYTANWSVDGVSITDNTFGPVRLNVIAAGAQGDVSDVMIARNNLVGESLSVLDIPPTTLTPRRHTWSIIDNHSDTKFGSPVAAYRITYTDGVVITGNYQPLQSGRWPVQVAVCTTGSTGVIVSGNQFVFM